MPVDQPFNLYRDQLTSQYHGNALWNPNPVEGLYDFGRVSIGDVGYLCDGDFIRMFNVTLPWDNPSNAKLGIPEGFESLEQGPFVNVRHSRFPEAVYHSPYVSKEENAGNPHAATPDEYKGQTYKCRNRSHGALLSLPHGGRREDVIQSKAFRDYIREHVDSWFTWAQNHNLEVERVEDLILVTGCTLVSSWAAAAFDDTSPIDATSISLDAQKLNGGGAEFSWRNIRGNVEYHNSHFNPNDEQPLPQNQCVFIRGFRAKRIFFRTNVQAAAEPLPDDPDNNWEDKIQVRRIPNVSRHRDPLVGVLDYIVEKCLEDGTAEDSDTIAIVHDDDLQLVEDAETLTADTIEKFLREKQMPLLVENGAAILRDPRNKFAKNERDRLQKDIQHWLAPPDPSTNHHIAWKAHHPGTSSWFFESDTLTKWKKTGSFLMIHGKPGSGKSTLLSAIIQNIEGMRAAGLASMAYFYCDFRDGEKQNLYGILSSLIVQLSSDSDSYFNILSQSYSDHSHSTRKPDIDALKKCMTDILTLPGQAPIYIVIDALDECLNSSGMPSARGKVLELIEELIHLRLPNLHLCVSSRLEMDIQMVLKPLASLEICLHAESGQREDIAEYIKSVVHSDRNMRRWKEEDKQLVIGTLSDSADGMFRWAVCQLDELRRTFPASIRSVLSDLPRTLDETYRRTLLGIDEEKREYAQRLFQCLTVSIRPLRVEELADVLAIRFDKALPTFNAGWRPENPEMAVFSACSSLISMVNMEGCRVVQFSHFSVREYLTSERLAVANERLSYYHILPEPAHTILAHACLGVLLQLDDRIDRDAIVHFPLAPYAARHWINHAQFRNVSSHILEVMERLFDPTKPHFAAWVWLYDFDRHWVQPMSKIHPTRPEALQLYYAALCGFRDLVGHLLISHLSDINCKGGSYTTPLHAATVKGHVDVISLLLRSGADPNSRDNLGRVPLHRVAHSGHLVMEQSSLEIARLLVNSGANVNVTDDQGWTPLHAAARGGYREIAERLLGSGASLDARNQKQQTPLHLSCSNGKLDISCFLVDCGSDLESRDNDGFSPLHSASRYGHVDVARLLLDCGSDVNVRETQRWTPLHLASRYGHRSFARLLVARGADVSAHAADLWTPMHLASANGHLDIVKLLLERGADVDSRNDDDETPLNHAARNGFLDIARILIERGAAMSARDNKGWTPFHKASKCGHLPIARLLLERGIDVDIQNGSEETSLYLASGSGKLDVARFLIEHGADIDTRDNRGLNPLHIASQNGHLYVVQMLVITGISVDIRNKTQTTPLALASSKGKVKVGSFLIERGADVNARDKQSRAPLHFATQFGHLDLARLLLDHGVDANVQKDNLWSPLHLASAHGHVRVAELLVQYGARVDVFNCKQETPLHLAAGNGNVDIARLLIDHGANLHTMNSNNWTPLHAASRRGHIGVVRLLLRRGADANVLNKANKTAAELASENGKDKIARLIVEYEGDASTTRGATRV